MAVLGVGVDVVDLARFEATLERTPSVRQTLFTLAEAELPLDSLAARFAAKEALMKAFKVDQALPWHDIEVVADPVGAPTFVLRGAAADRLAQLNARVHLSLSHDTSVATAFVVVEEC